MESNYNREQNRKKKREELRQYLQNHTDVVGCRYEGYNDNGAIEDIFFDEVSVYDFKKDFNNKVLSDLEEFFFELSYEMEDGWEVDSGAVGTLTWDLKTDKILAKHRQYYTESIESINKDLR